MDDATTPMASEQQSDPLLPPLPSTLRQYTFQPSAPLEHASAPPLYPHMTGTLPNAEWSDNVPHECATDITLSSFSVPSAPPLYPVLQDTSSPSPYPSLIGHNPIISSPASYTPKTTVLPAFAYVLPIRNGLSRNELHDLYRPPSDISDILSDFERRSTMAVHNNDLYDYMNAYERASASVQQTNLALFRLQQKAKGYAGKLWTVRTKTEVVQAACADGATISHSYSYQIGNYEPDMAAKLKKSLQRLMVKKSRLLVRQKFEEMTCRLWIEDKISSVLNNASWATQDHHKERRDSDMFREDLEIVKKYLDVLFYFERTVRRQPDFDDGDKETLEEIKTEKTSSDAENADGTGAADDTDQSPNGVILSIRRWITLLVAAILEYGNYSDRIYLLMHVFRSRHAVTWSATFLQCTIPKHWSDPFLDYYLLQYSLILCGPSPLTTKEEGVTLLWGQNLDEDDYLAIIDQLDIPIFFQRLVDHYCSPSSSNSGKVHRGYVERRCLRVLAICHSMFDWTITGLERHLQYPVMAKRLVQTLCQLCQILGDHLMVLHLPVEGSLSLQSAMTPIQIEIDNLFLRVLRAIVGLPSHGLWNFLPSIPFQFMSHHAIITLLEETALKNIESWIMNPMKLLETSPESNHLRNLLGRNPSEGVFFLTALALMAQSKLDSHGPQIEDLLTQEQILGFRMAEIITFLLVDVAFLDSDIRSELAKPTREILASLCDSATDLIPFVLRIVDRHFEELGTMAFFLFKELPLEEWNIGEQDFAILIKLLEHPPLGSPASMFAQHVLGSLDWGRTQRIDGTLISGPPHGHVPLALHKELALSLADICIAYMNRTVVTAASTTDTVKPMETTPPNSSTPPEATDTPTTPLSTSFTADQGLLSSFTSAIPQAVVNLAANSGIHSLTEHSAWKSFMDWAWSMLVKLRMIDVPVLSLRQASRLHFQDTNGFFSKAPLLNQGQQAFVKAVHLMLTEASRDPEAFALEGWTTLSSVLQADQGVALVSMLCDVLPMLMSVQKDEGEPQYTKFAVMLQEIANHKPDPMLALAGHAIAEATIQFPINNVPVDLLGIWVIMRRSLSFATLSDTAISPFSTTHQSIDDERAKKVLQFWLSSVFAQKDWMMHSEFVQIMDLICLTADELGLEGFVKDLLLEQQILLSIGYRRSPGMSGEIMGIAQPKLDRVMDLLPERLSRALPIPQGSNDPSLLVGSWSVKTFATTLFTQQPMVETKSFWFAYQVLKVETHLEREMRMKVGLHYEQHPEELDVRGNIKTIVKKLGITNRKTIFNFSIWRWVQHLLVLPMDHTLQPLYWYMFFNLYFSHTQKDHVFYGYKFLESSTPMLDGDSIIGQLKDRLQKLYTRFGQEARKCIQSKQVDRAEKLTKLHDLYLAMFGWLSEPLLLSSEIELHRIRKDLLPDRLATCRLTDQQECNADLWRDLLVPQILTSELAQQQTASKSKPEQKLQHSSSPSSPQSRRPSFFAKAIGHTSSQADSPGSRPQSRLSPRMQRKQSYPRHEQKISTCLVQQAKPGPACCTSALLIRMPSLLDRETNVDGLFREIAQTFKDCAKAYFNTMETYKYLDKSYLDELQALYHNEARTKRLDIACDSTPNTLCKKPAVFELRFEEIVTNEKVRGLVVDNRTRIQELNVGSVDTNLCLAALKAAKIIEEMLDLLTSSQKSDDYQSKKRSSTLEGEARERLHQLAVESFYFIHGELLKDAENGYPPAQLILERTVDSLGKRIVAFDASQTESVLDLMGTSSFTISLLHQIFNPANEPKKFVQYYKRIATCKEYELSSKDLLLQQFDVFAWACPENSDPSDTMEENIITVMDRLAFYEVAFTAMMSQQQQEQQDKEISERELRTMDRLAIIKSHRELAGTLLLNFLGEDYINYLRILLDTCAITCLEPEVIQDYIRILGVDPRLVLSLLDGSHVNYQPGEMQATVDASNSSSGPQLSTIEKRQQQLRNRKGYRDQTLERQEAARKGMTRLGLSDYDLGCLVQFLEDYFTQCQESMAHGNLLDRYNGYVIYIADLIAIVLCDERFLIQWMDQSARAASNAISYNQSQQQPLYDAPNLCPLWRDTLRVFKPWLSCLAEHAVDENRFQRQQGGASRILFTFVGIVNKALESIYRHFQDPSWSEISLFDTYLNIIQGGIGSQGTVNQVMLLHQHFRRLDWKQLEWSYDTVSRMLYIQSKLDVETRAEFWTYLVTVIMDKIQTKLWGHHSWDTQAGPFELSLLRLGLCILQDIGQVTRRDRELETLFLYRIWSVILGYYPWHEQLTTEQLSEQIEHLPVQWERATSLMDLENPLGVLLLWLRITVGLEAGQNLLQGDLLGEWQQQHLQEQSDGSMYRSEHEPALQSIAIDALQPERVYLYFQYLLRLVLVRLSSSASDDQNFNFSLDALPAVVAHLGQVLDLIAGDRTETRHDGIAGPLANLLGLVNHCYKTGYHRTLEVILEGFRAMLSLDLDAIQVFQLDFVRACCQSLTSIPLMVFLLEGAMEREFDLWNDWYAQTGKLFVHPGSSSMGTGIGTGLLASTAQLVPSHGLMNRSDLAIVSTALPIIAASSPFMSSDLDTMSPGTEVEDVAVPTLYGTPRNSFYDSPAVYQQQQYEQPPPQIRGRQSWRRICQQLETPEMAEQEFLEQCLEQGAMLTLHAWFLQRLHQCESHFGFDAILELGQELALVIARVDLSGGPLSEATGARNGREQHEGEAGGGGRSGGILSWVSQRSPSFYNSGNKHSSNTADGGRSSKGYQVLLLLKMYLRCVSKEAVYNVKQSRFIDSLQLICETLEGWFQEREDSGRKFLPIYGLWTSLTGHGSSPQSASGSTAGSGSSSTGFPRTGQRSHASSGSPLDTIQPLPLRVALDTKLKLVSRILYTYIATRLQDKGIPPHRTTSRSAGTSSGWRRTSLQPQSNSRGQDRQAQAPAGGTSSPKPGMDLVETLINLPIKEKEYTAILVADENRGGNTNDSSTAARSNSPSFATAAAARHIGNPASPPRSSSAGAIYRTQPQQHTLTESRHSHSGSESSLLALALGRTSIGHPRSYSGSGSSIYSEDSGAGTGHRRSISSSWDESAMEYIRLRPPSWIALGHGMDGLNGLRPASISAVATKKQNNGHKGSDLTSDERHQFFVLRPDPQQRSRKQIMVATTSPTSHSSKAGGGMRRSHLVLQRDFDWAVDQIQDRRMRILEAHEFLNGLMMRFYPDEARFAT